MRHIENIQKLFSKNFVQNPLVESFDAGKIHLSTGKLVACDPLLTNDMLPFSISFPVGDFPIIIHQEKDQQAIAYVEIVFSQQNCEKWEMATLKGQDLKNLKKGEIFGFPVASGMACFMDEETQKELNDLEQNLFNAKGDNFLGIYDEFFHSAFFEGKEMKRNFALLQPNQDKLNTIFAFDTGESEGFYASYIGFDAENIPVKIIMELIEIGED
jgi:hypothetical protein